MKGTSPVHTVVAGFCKGNYHSFYVVYEQYCAELFCFVQQLSGHTKEAGTIVTEIFIKLLQRRELFNSMEDIKAFLYLAARQNCLQLLQLAKQKSPGKEFPVITPVNAEPSADNKTAAPAVIIKQYLDTIESLPAQTDHVLRLLYKERMTVTAVAEELTITAPAVLKHKAKALEILQQTGSIQQPVVHSLLIYYLAVILPGDKPADVLSMNDLPGEQ